MAAGQHKQRFISTSFWDDEWVSELDPSEKLLFLYLMTNPLTNIAGVYEITLRRISFDTGFNKDQIEKILERFEKAKKAYYHEKHIIIPKWPTHQKWDIKPKIKVGIEKCLLSLPEIVFNKLSCIGYEYPIDSLSEKRDTLSKKCGRVSKKEDTVSKGIDTQSKGTDTVPIDYAYPSSYRDRDSDLEFDRDSDRDSAMHSVSQPETSQAPEPKKSKPKPKAPKTKIDSGSSAPSEESLYGKISLTCKALYGRFEISESARSAIESFRKKLTDQVILEVLTRYLEKKSDKLNFFESDFPGWLAAEAKSAKDRIPEYTPSADQLEVQEIRENGKEPLDESAVEALEKFKQKTGVKPKKSPNQKIPSAPPQCPGCGQTPKIRDGNSYEAVCGQCGQIWQWVEAFETWEKQRQGVAV